MAERVSIKRPELLRLKTDSGAEAVGGFQEWYEEHWHKMSGCGPVAASNLVWYLARSRPECKALCDADGGFSSYRRLMDDMFGYITPGLQGVNSTSIFVPGLLGYCEARGLSASVECLEVPRRPRAEPTAPQLREHLERWLRDDCPVAFLNLSNGTLSEPDSWHWVTVLALEPDSLTALISDEGRTYEARLGEWLDTSLLGGAFAALRTRTNP